MDIFNQFEASLLEVINEIISLYYLLDMVPASRRTNRFYRELAQAGREHAAAVGISDAENDAFVRYWRRTYNTAQTMPEDQRIEYFVCEIFNFLDSSVQH